MPHNYETFTLIFIEIICGFFGHWEGYINALNAKKAEFVFLNVGCLIVTAGI